MRRCIYCGTAEDLSDSDIIPDALTASRIINKCVCHVEHNSGMTEKFESEVVENPSHICLLRNMKEKSLAVIACDGKDNMSIRVPDGFLDLHKSFKIHSKQFVYETLTSWGLNPEKTYSFKGEYLEEQKMVVFGLKNVDL